MSRVGPQKSRPKSERSLPRGGHVDRGRINCVEGEQREMVRNQAGDAGLGTERNHLVEREVAGYACPARSASRPFTGRSANSGASARTVSARLS